jgi:hypothetical protein
MKKLFLLGVFALGLMSFETSEDPAVDCFAQADAAVAFAEANALYVAPGASDRYWDHVFTSCSRENGQLLPEVVVIVKN